MFNIEKAHYILDEMIANGQIVETNKSLILGKGLLIQRRCMSSTSSQSDQSAPFRIALNFWLFGF